MKANQAMDRSEKLFQNIFANIPAGVEIYDKDGYLVDMNNMIWRYSELWINRQ